MNFHINFITNAIIFDQAYSSFRNDGQMQSLDVQVNGPINSSDYNQQASGRRKIAEFKMNNAFNYNQDIDFDRNLFNPGPINSVFYENRSLSRNLDQSGCEEEFTCEKQDSKRIYQVIFFLE